MLPKELVRLIEEQRVDQITIGRSAITASWSVCAHGTDLPRHLRQVIELNPEGGLRLWADIDAAYSFIRKSGYHRAILIEG